MTTSENDMFAMKLPRTRFFRGMSFRALKLKLLLIIITPPHLNPNV